MCKSLRLRVFVTTRKAVPYMDPRQLTAGSATTAVRNIMLRGRMTWHVVVLFASREEEFGRTSVAVSGFPEFRRNPWVSLSIMHPQVDVHEMQHVWDIELIEPS